jgi:hypothetical protein
MPGAAPDDMRMAHREARVPLAPPLGMLALEIGNILNRRAKARGTNHGAIRAGQAAVGHVVPSRMLIISIEKFFDSGGPLSCPLDPRLV